MFDIVNVAHCAVVLGAMDDHSLGPCGFPNSTSLILSLILKLLLHGLHEQLNSARWITADYSRNGPIKMKGICVGVGTQWYAVCVYAIDNQPICMSPATASVSFESEDFLCVCLID